MKILITGSKGQMGMEFQVISRGDPVNRYLFTDIEELDITDPIAVTNLIRKEKPEVIINCAGYTAVDQAEQEPEKAILINGTAVEILAKAANETESILIQLSTDYVFDGTAFTPYREDTPPHPLSAYAKSKFEGEQAVINHANRGVIIRTSWLYSSYGQNFVKTILKYGRERDSLSVIFDQIGTPTYARDLCRTIQDILPALNDHWGVELFHYSNEGVASWYDFAKAIAELAGMNCQILPIESKDYLQLASRPFYSVLNKAKIKARFGISIPYWRDSLLDCILKLTAGE
ncbi:MAG: dTDP-4-dehydrorhamnose reductase [Bacteroidales bacterium]|nr:dTDP-4-dehydrorhamnose reductase [Bacteroidales bacterium]